MRTFPAFIPRTQAISGPSDVGTAGYALLSDGEGGTLWGEVGGGSPGGSTGQLQYNNNGAFGGTAAITYAATGVNLRIAAPNATDVPLVVQGAAAQSANLTEWRDATGAVLHSAIHNDGRLIVPMGTASSPSLGFDRNSNGVSKFGWYLDSSSAIKLAYNNNAYIALHYQGIVLSGTAAGTKSGIFWNNTTTMTAANFGVLDLGLVRSSEGLLEVNNGNKGTYRDMRARFIVLNGDLKCLGLTSTAADPTTAELTADKDIAIHKNTSSGDVFLAFNDGGTIKKVALV